MGRKMSLFLSLMMKFDLLFDLCIILCSKPQLVVLRWLLSMHNVSLFLFPFFRSYISGVKTEIAQSPILSRT